MPCCCWRWRCSGRRASRPTPSTRWSDQAVAAATRRRAAQRGLRQRRAAPLRARARGDRRRGARRSARALQPSGLVARAPARRLARSLAGDRCRRQHVHPPMTLRISARRTTAAAFTSRRWPRTASTRSRSAARRSRSSGRCRWHSCPASPPAWSRSRTQNAQRAACCFSPRPLAPGARVLDACAAPGGKTGAPARDRRHRPARDRPRSSAAGARSTRPSLRLGLAAETRAADAAAPARWWDGRPFAAILLDAPCSASGIVRRHPDVRWLRRSSDLQALAATQARLLDALWPLLAPGGRLLYVTCSVFKAEGSAQIDAFLQRAGDAALAASPPSPGQLLSLPDNDATPPSPGFPGAADGFFLALLEKPPSAPKTARP